MNLDSLNKWLMLAANLGVIAGIIFLALELNQNNELMQAEAQFRIKENRISGSVLMKESPEWAALQFKWSTGSGDLTDLEKARIRSNLGIIFINWEWEFGEYQAGRIDREYIPFARNLSNFMKLPLVSDQWEVFKINNPVNPDFVDYIETEWMKQR